MFKNSKLASRMNRHQMASTIPPPSTHPQSARVPPRSVAPLSTHPQSARAPQSRPPASRRSTWPAGPKRNKRATAKPRKTNTKIPTIRRSFVVEVLPRDEPSGVINARFTPSESAAKSAVENNFRLNDSLLDVISDFLVKLAREEE